MNAEGTATRQVFSGVIAAVLLATVSAGAQMRRPRAAPPRREFIRPPTRIETRVPISRGAPRVRPVEGNRRVFPSSPQQPPAGPLPLSPATGGTVPIQPLNSAVAPAGGTPIPLGQILNPTPGLGFDFNHLAAVNSGLAVRAFIDPVTEHELAVDESLPQETPVGVGFFPAFGFGGEFQEPAANRPAQIIVVQERVAQPAAVTTPAATPAPAAAAPSIPPLPVGSLYLVLRDGKTIKVIAFTQQAGQVVYITANGRRRSIALRQLDIKATEQRNAESGTILHLSK